MSNKILSHIKFGLLLLFIFSCSTKKHNPSDILEEIMKADNEGDIEKIISLYTRDAMLLPAGKANISGKDSIRQNYKNIFSTSKLELSASTDEVIESGNTAVIRGTTVGKVIQLNDSNTNNINDKFIMILKKESGNWKIYRLMWSRNE